MPIFIYNSLTRKKEELIPIKPPVINIYSCGVTVYDECHIGHARSLYIFDVIRRYLNCKGFKVNFVRNITDVDDKIINRANELKIDWQELVKRYIDSYYEDLTYLRIDKADCEPRATENISEMIRYIDVLIKKGYAYRSGSDVYFDVRKFPSYGKLSGQGIDEMLKGARIAPSELKHDPLDFALWKGSKEGEPSWESPFGKGRPGWHIECSVMSQKFLKTDTLDIHAGGRDLLFPHHENEIAQAESLTGRQFAKYWLHHGLLSINGQKMAKSLGNFITIKDFIKRYNDADLLKLFFLSAHYSHPIDYNDTRIEETKRQKKGFDSFFDKVDSWQLVKDGSSKSLTVANDIARIDDICGNFERAMDDDFNTAGALASMFELINISDEFISTDKKDAFNYARLRLENFFSIFGLKVKTKKAIGDEFKHMVMERQQARRNKEFAKADRIRKEIEEEFNGILADTVSGITFVER